MKETVSWAAAGYAGEMKKTFKIITLGCKVNQYESAYLTSRLQEEGWRPVGHGEVSDVSIINTCIVTQAAAHQSRQEIRKAIRENPEGYVAAIGCYGQALPAELGTIEGLRLIAGNVGKGGVADLIRNSLNSKIQIKACEPFPRVMPIEPMEIESFHGRRRAYLKIQDGCESFCSYCIVPFSRGPYRSLRVENILEMLGNLAGEGYREVVLTGIHLGKYGIDLAGNCNLKDLLRAIGKEKLPLRIRLSSLEPGEIDEELIGMMATEQWLCRHVHIPLQSGDDRILKRMNRKYSTGTFARLVENIHQKIPMAAIGVDVMAGFPGEDSRAHSNTVSLLKILPVSYLHVFPYSKRSGTRAAGFSGHIASHEKKKRAAELRALSMKKRRDFYERCVGEVFQVLAEGWYSTEKGLLKGTSDNYVPTFFPPTGSEQKDLVSIRMEKVDKHGMMGRKLSAFQSKIAR